MGYRMDIGIGYRHGLCHGQNMTTSDVCLRHTD
jgi:hypothetical protein